MKGKPWVQLYQALLCYLPQSVRLRIAYTHGINMNHGLTVKLIAELVLNGIDQLVEGQKVAFGGDFRMQGNQYTVWSIIMYDQVM